MFRTIIACTAIVAGGIAIAPNGDASDDCTDAQGGRVDGTLVITVPWDQAVPCDVTPGMRLDLLWTSDIDPAFGTDATVRTAVAACDHAGGDPVFHQGPYRMVCESVDF